MTQLLLSVPRSFRTAVCYSSSLLLAIVLCVAPSAKAAIVTVPTMDSTDLENALNATGLTIDSVSALNGTAGQFGTYSNFSLQPITIGDGVVLSSGNVTNIGPFAKPPGYDPASPPGDVNSDMGTPGTTEFDTYGSTIHPVTGNTLIENFNSSNDVAVLRVDFTLDEDSRIQFDFVFGSVEYPFWTSSFTDSFLVFLDGTDPVNQITYDNNGVPVQVGKSFAGLVSIADNNTAFSDPHGVMGLTTTSRLLSAGEHTLWFEVGDVNDHILDSAVFIANLRTGFGRPGLPEDEDETEWTDPSDPVVPEPASIAIWGIGCASLGIFRLYRKRTS